MLKRNKEKQSLTLVLGGGGARGMAHVGVLRILEREEIPISRIVSTSMGAVIGAMYAQHPDVAEADVVLRPKVGAQHWSEFEHADMFVRLGEEACEEALPKIREMVGIKK